MFASFHALKRLGLSTWANRSSVPEQKPNHQGCLSRSRTSHRRKPLSDYHAPQVGFFSGLFTAVQWNITQCVYCAYDAFSRLDVRCHMAIPGGVIAYAVDCKGQRYGLREADLSVPDLSALRNVVCACSFMHARAQHPSNLALGMDLIVSL